QPFATPLDLGRQSPAVGLCTTMSLTDPHDARAGEDKQQRADLIIEFVKLEGEPRFENDVVGSERPENDRNQAWADTPVERHDQHGWCEEEKDLLLPKNRV